MWSWPPRLLASRWRSRRFRGIHLSTLSSMDRNKCGTQSVLNRQALNELLWVSIWGAHWARLEVRTAC